jgi:FkbM family methyltransferase
MKHIFRKLKVILRAAVGKDFLLTPEVKCTKERFGTEYGGWFVCTSNIRASSVVYSFGIGEDASFDSALIDKYALTVHAFDPTPKSIAWVQNQGFSESFVMHEYGLANLDGNVSFHPPQNPNHVSHSLLDKPSLGLEPISVPVKRLSTIMNELGHAHIDILKMDIEGAEYSVIDDISCSSIRPQQILIEFHHRFPNVGIAKTKLAIETLKSLGYSLFYVSASNEEFCFIRTVS